MATVPPPTPGIRPGGPTRRAGWWRQLAPWRPESAADRALLVRVGWGRLGLTLVGLVVAVVTPDIDPNRGHVALLFLLAWLPISLVQLLLAHRGRGAARRVASIVLDVAAVSIFLAVPQPASGVLLGFMVFVGLHALLDSYAGGLLTTGLSTGALVLANSLSTESSEVLTSREVVVFASAALAMTAMTGYAARIIELDARELAASYRLAQDQLDLTLESAEMGLWQWVVPEDRIEWSADTLRIYGRTEPPPDFASFLELVHPDDRAKLTERLEHAMATGGTYQVQHRTVLDGRTHWLLGKGRLYRDEHGAPLRLIGAVTDVTEQLEQQQQLERARRMDTVSGLAGGFAHDFNNVLGVIILTAEVLGRSELDDAQRERVEFLLEASRRGAGVTNKLLAFARREPGHPVAVRLDDLVAGAGPMLERALRADVRLTVDIPASLPPVLADPGLLEQALLNLAMNARDAIPGAGEVRISARTASGDGAPAVVVEVADDGIGMTEDVSERAIEPFFTTKGPDRGTGLGLASVYSTVTALGGRVEIDSHVDRGTTVRLVLPATADAPPAATAPVSDPVAGTPMRLLLVEDDSGIRVTLADLLTGLGHHVVTAVDGRDALRLVDGGYLPDLVLTDVVMPNLSGPGLVAELARRGSTCGVLYMTGDVDRDLAPVAGSLPLLRKPFTLDDLVAALAEARVAAAGRPGPGGGLAARPR